MRSSRAPALAQAFIFAVAFILGFSAFAPSAAAQQQKFDRLFVFGDSYTDVNLAPLWRVYPLPLQQDLGIPQIVPFGVGGARASPSGPPAVVPPGFHLPQQVDFYLTTNNPIGPHDLVTINIGGNDIRAILGNILTPADNTTIGYPAVSINTGNAKTFADQTAFYATTEINRLINHGGRNFVLGEFSSISGLPSLQAFPQFVKDAADAYAKAYFEDMQTKLVPSAQAGVRFFIFDLARLGAAVNANPAKYGFSGGFLCPTNGLPDPASGICGATIANPTINNPLQTQYYIGPDGLHLTSGGFALVAEYMANIVMAPDTIAVQPGIVAATAGSFTGAIQGRLDSIRQQVTLAGLGGPTDADGFMGLGRKDAGRAPYEAPSRFTTYSMGTFAGGNHSDSFALSGFDYESTSGTSGIEYRAGPGLIVGLAGNYTTTRADLNSGADINIEALQVASYLSYSSRHWFGDALVAYGHDDLDMSRPGVISAIRGSTDASSLAAAARAGYLFDFGKLRAGPIAGLTYVHSRVDGYTETGDPLLTFNVSAQTLDTVTGNVGIQFRAPFVTGGTVFSPFLNVTLEHQFGDNTRTMTATLTQAPILPILSPVPNFDTRTYGKVEGGLTIGITPDLSATLNAATTFAREEGNDYRISAGVNYRF